eukprot:scaffold5413_cov117-Isochrysis_galbana.AAC.2
MYGGVVCVVWRKWQHLLLGRQRGKRSRPSPVRRGSCVRVRYGSGSLSQGVGAGPHSSGTLASGPQAHRHATTGGGVHAVAPQASEPTCCRGPYSGPSKQGALLLLGLWTGFGLLWPSGLQNDMCLPACCVLCPGRVCPAPGSSGCLSGHAA